MAKNAIVEHILNGTGTHPIIYWQALNTDGSPIFDNNGIQLRNLLRDEVIKMLKNLGYTVIEQIATGD